MRRIFLKLWRRRKLHQDLETELAFHRDMAREHNNHISLGNATAIREQAFDLWRFTLLENLWRDLVYAARSLRRSPALVLAALLSLGLGIGANTAIFSLVNTIVLRLLPVERPEELEQVTLRDAWILGAGKVVRGTQTQFSYAFFQELRRQGRIFSGVFARMVAPASLFGAGNAEHGTVELVSGDYFDVLGVRPFLGRTISAADDRVPLGHPVAVLGFHYWRKKLSADTAILGKIIRIDNHPFTVIGVAPPAFFGVEVGSVPDVWAPIMMQPLLFPGARPIFDDNAGEAVEILGRRAPGVTAAQAQSGVSVIYDRLQQQQSGRPSGSPKEAIHLEPAGKGLSRLRTDFENPLYVLMAAAALVLLIACANIANLLLARSAARRKEMTVRLALGAGRSRLMRQLLTESTLLSLLGGVLGVAFANWGVRLLLAFLPAQRLPFVLEVHTDARVLGFALAISVLTGLLFGMAPAFQSARADLVESLKDEGARLRVAARPFELRNALVISQVALSLLLLVGAGLFLRSLQNTAAIRVGMDTENVLLASIDARLSGYTSTQAQDFFRRLEAQLREKPGVRAVGSSQTRLLSGYWDTISISVPGRPKPGGQRQILMNVIAGDFYRVAGIQILRGRDFGTRDTAAGSKVAIINETGARYFFGDSDPVGRTVRGGGRFGDIEIIGIASDSKYLSVREEMPRTLYFTAEQIPQLAGQRTIYVRTAGDPTRYGEVVRNEVRALDKQLPVYNIRTFAGQKADSLARERLIALLSGFFGALALLLAAIGLYGVMAYAVLRRTREIGIRLSLGADRSAVVWMVFRSALGMAVAGIGIGLPLSLWLSRLVTSQLYGVRPSDPATLATACIVLAGIAVLAASIPAWRASRVDPMVALRYE